MRVLKWLFAVLYWAAFVTAIHLWGIEAALFIPMTTMIAGAHQSAKKL